MVASSVPGGGSSRRGLLSWALYDWANSAHPTVVQTFVFAAFFTRRVAETETVGASQWGLAMGVAGGITALLGPVLGAVADQGGRRKPWIAALAGLSIVATAALWFVAPGSAVLPALVLLVASTACFQLANVFYDAMLPGLAGRRIGRWSGWGWGLGYVGGLLCLVLCLLLLVRPEGAWLGLDRDAAEHVRATFPLAAAWFALFSLPFFLWTPDREGSGKPPVRAVRDGFAQLRGSLRLLRRHPGILRFLVARMLYADGLATLFAFGGVYAAGTFGMDEGEVLLFGIALNVTAGLGAAVFGWVDDRLGSKPTILLSLASLVVLTAGALLVGQQSAFLVLGVTLGLFVGPIQAASRSYLGRVAPEAVLTQLFGVYALAGKATSFAGPLLVSAVTAWSGSQRIGMGVIVGLLAAGGAVLLTVPSMEGDRSGDG